MDQEPAAELHAQPARGEERNERAKHQAVGDDQEARRHAEGKTERKGEQGDLRVVSEEIGREDRQPALPFFREQRRAQLLGRCGGCAPFGQPG